MDFDRQWTQFALDAEVDAHGVGRIADAHNRQLAAKDAEIERLKQKVNTIAVYLAVARDCRASGLADPESIYRDLGRRLIDENLEGE